MNITTNQYVQNLKNRLNETKEYWEDDGTFDRGKTAWARMRVLKATEPSTAEDIVAFVIFLESINVLQNEEIRNKAKRVIDLAGLHISKDHMAIALDILAKYERPKGFFDRLFNDHTKKFKKDYNPFHDLPAETPFQI